MAKYYKYGTAQYKATEKYKKAHIKRIVLSLNKNTDQDIITYLEAKNNVQGEIKRLIRKEIKHGIH